MVLVGATVNGKANFMAVGWVTYANFGSPKILLALNSFHHTNKGILEHGEFSINVPSTDLIVKTDYCGIVSGDEYDKSKIFEVFQGELKHAPMIQECPVNIECKLVKTVEIEKDILLVGEIINTYTEEKYLTDGKTDLSKIKPFIVTMPDNNYWSIGDKLQKAWSVGKEMEQSLAK
jgi:flavin reductase (DIM6/NTAB) family NADH-FMN oxidoreductase RutF